MKFSIPFLQEKIKESGNTKYCVRPLFQGPGEFEASREELRRATDSSISEYRKSLRYMAAFGRHELLAKAAFCPEFKEHTWELEITLRRRFLKGKFFAVSYPALNGHVVYLPQLPEQTFHVPRGQDMQTRATEVLTAHYREAFADNDIPDQLPDVVRGSVWVSVEEFRLDVQDVFGQEKPDRRASLGPEHSADGAEELERVGRLLNRRYPDDLAFAINRQPLVEEVFQLLGQTKQRPLLIVGKSGTGKSAILENVIAKLVHASDNDDKIKPRECWLVSPQRLISGMSYVGQWEDRLHAILSFVKKKRHILLFDDLIGLFRAGVSASSDISVADILKPLLEEQETQLIGECTHEQYKILRERDRGFTDLFHVIRIEEQPMRESAEVLIHMLRDLESRSGCRFDSDVLPVLIGLQSRYQRDTAFPGKGAMFLKQLANKFRNEKITRADCMREFEAQSGLSIDFIDANARLSRSEIIDGLRQNIIGQDGAVEALANSISVAKARLNDPGRPLGSFLFLGPTGVGKTQCAKALARYLFGSDTRLIRFDMNEFTDSYAVTRLVGTLSKPEGMLTSAVRRTPFCVLLFDEIEKSDPSAYDTLLQVLGEGRLTDAIGRTADFSNTMIVMTSNLGVSEAEGGLGIGGHENRGDEAYLTAARRFFRPEFFNRIDRIIPFRRLTREQTEDIARSVLHDVFAREGLSRRQCVLNVEASAMTKMVDAGFHPELGARAIKRSIERWLTAPISAQLSTLATGTPTAIQVSADGDTVKTKLSAIEPAARHTHVPATVDLSDTEAVIKRIDSILNHAEEQLDAMRPTGSISSNASLEQRNYFQTREQYDRLDKLHEWFVEWFDRAEQASHAQVDGAAKASARLERQRPRLPAHEFIEPTDWLKFRRADDIFRYFEPRNEFTAVEIIALERASRIRSLLGAAATLSAMLNADPSAPEDILLVARVFNNKPHTGLGRLVGDLQTCLRHRFGLASETLDINEPAMAVMHVSGFMAQAFATAETGTHLWIQDAELTPICVSAIDVPTNQDPAVLAKTLIAGSDQVLPVVRTLLEDGSMLDVRTGILTKGRPETFVRSYFTQSALPEKS
ncbi:MAG: AAA family ATPase [Planctomycetes bacterium]|nr:AAA family ATPase [Planctomycetota bacterium]